jgi:hypothetical protein
LKTRKMGLEQQERPEMRSFKVGTIQFDGYTIINATK